MQNPRELRGLAILALGNQIHRIDSESYRVESQSGNGEYLVAKVGEEWVCGCPDNTYRRSICKHNLRSHGFAQDERASH